MRKLYVLLVTIVLCMCSCREQYDPKAISSQRSFLVVEANLDPGPDSTIIRLTRTFSLDDTARLRGEDNAIVTIEGEDNSTRSLVPRRHGYYVSSNLNLTINTGYRLHIKTTNGNEYLSDYVKARTTPSIDSINSEETDSKLWVYANTRDLTGNSKYYRWSFDETWEIHSHYYSEYIWDAALNDTRPRILPEEEVYRCWKYDTTATILLANSTRLREDIIYRTPLTAIPLSNEKVSIRYSMHVRQYALDKGAYDFFELMKKNTEEIGSVFSPQPFELQGNIHCINDNSEYTLGYITVSTVQKQRIFVTVRNPAFIEDCPFEKFGRDTAHLYFSNGGFMPYAYDYGGDYYKASYPRCVDCRQRGGNLARPSFW
jgi:hypothetical protein